MNLEQLTKTQIVLLTLFVSFVTSIATGIVTVTLMDQAPIDVTRTINRVVEKTVERVVQGETKVIERIKEISNPTASDLAISAVEKTRPVLVYVKTETGSEWRGFFVSSKGDAVLLIDASILEGEIVNLTYFAPGATTTKEFPARIKKVSESGLLALAAIIDPPKVGLSFVNLAQALVPSVGQQVLSIGYERNLGVNVEFGNVTALLDNDSSEGSRRFVTTLPATPSHIGSPVVDVTARVMGIELGAREGINGTIVLPLPAIDTLFGQVLSASSTSSIRPTP